MTEAFAIFGLAVFLFVVIVLVSMLLNIALGYIDEEVLYGPGYLVVMLILSILLSLFFIQPEKFGYEKIVSNNSVEQEVEHE
jgi:membrane protease YdiL (CAAX protease family)